MISLKEAQQLVLAEAHSFGKEIILLEEALGRILNEPLFADRDYPPFNRATMDGIAIKSKDWENGIRRFEIAETIFAGDASSKEIKLCECYKIMTGAAVPSFADTIIRIEDCELTENSVTVTVSGITTGQNIALQGSDIKREMVLFDQPQLIKPGLITTLASLGYAEVKVSAQPSVAILTTGNEVVAVDAPVNKVQIRNSNIFLLRSLLEQWKIKPAISRHLNDNADTILNNIKQQLHHDIIIMSGAVSAGDADFVPEVLIKAGAKKIFHKVTIRPGKPIWFGRFEKGPVVFALPGNPFSTFVTFKLFIESFLRKSFGLEQESPIHLPFNGSRVKKTNLDEFFPVSIAGNPAATIPVTFNTSGDITAVMHADALAMQPIEKPELKNGDIVCCQLL